MMKNTARGLLTLLCLVMTGLLCTSCKATLKPQEEGVYNDRTKTYYHHASTVYEATALVKEYGTLKVNDKSEYTLYTIPGMDAVEMLATEEYNVLYAVGDEMPTLLEMAPTILHVCTDSTTVHEIKRMEDSGDIYSLVHAYTNDPSIPYPGITPLRNYRVRFESTQYPGFYYTLAYIEYGEDIVIDGKNYGRFFLRSVFENTCVPVSNVIHRALGYED